MAGKKKAPKVYEGGHPLADYIMSDEQQARRRNSIGGSDANTLMGGDPEKIYELWREKRGIADPQGDPSINMLMGTATEKLNAAWYHFKTGDRVTDMQQFAASDEFGYPAHATLDGLCFGGESIWEAKHTGGYDFGTKSKRSIDTVRELYMPQLQHNMMVTGLQRSVISVFFDNNNHDWCGVDADPFYQDALKEAEATFWACVLSGEPPGGIRKIESAPVVKEFREVIMTGNNQWAAAAEDYKKYKASVDVFESAATTLKSLVEADVGVASGYGLMVKRDKRGALRIYEE
jgi:predicted phage-related endonuclease